MTTPSEGDALAALLTRAADFVKDVAAFRCVRTQEEGDLPFNIVDYHMMENLERDLRAARGVRMPGSGTEGEVPSKGGGPSSAGTARIQSRRTTGALDETQSRETADSSPVSSPPSAPAGPWYAEGPFSNEDGQLWRVTSRDSTQDTLGPLWSEAEALAVRDALNLVASEK